MNDSTENKNMIKKDEKTGENISSGNEEKNLEKTNIQVKYEEINPIQISKKTAEIKRQLLNENEGKKQGIKEKIDAQREQEIKALNEQKARDIENIKEGRKVVHKHILDNASEIFKKALAELPHLSPGIVPPGKIEKKHYIEKLILQQEVERLIMEEINKIIRKNCDLQPPIKIDEQLQKIVSSMQK